MRRIGICNIAGPLEMDQVIFNCSADIEVAVYKITRPDVRENNVLPVVIYFVRINGI